MKSKSDYSVILSILLNQKFDEFSRPCFPKSYRIANYYRYLGILEFALYIGLIDSDFLDSYCDKAFDSVRGIL